MSRNKVKVIFTGLKTLSKRVKHKVNALIFQVREGGLVPTYTLHFYLDFKAPILYKPTQLITQGNRGRL